MTDSIEYLMEYYQKAREEEAIEKLAASRETIEKFKLYAAGKGVRISEVSL